MHIMPGRPSSLPSVTVRIQTTMGALFATVAYNEDYEIVETFINVGKSGAEAHALAEALGRSISLFLRHACGHSATERLDAVIDQLKGIASVNHGNVTSVPDSLAKALREAQEIIETREANAEPTD